MYNFNDPEDVARFHLNMLCGDLFGVMQDYATRFGREKVEPQVLAKFADVAVAIKNLDAASAPKAVTK